MLWFKIYIYRQSNSFISALRECSLTDVHLIQMSIFAFGKFILGKIVQSLWLYSVTRFFHNHLCHNIIQLYYNIFVCPHYYPLNSSSYVLSFIWDDLFQWDTLSLALFNGSIFCRRDLFLVPLLFLLYVYVRERDFEMVHVSVKRKRWMFCFFYILQ